MEDIILYHGSHGGIEGKIEPISRKRCDFGMGFYMGTNETQVKGLISEDSEPYIYRIKLKRYKHNKKSSHIRLLF